MENHWFTDDNEAMVSWSAVLPSRWDSSQLLHWTRNVITAGVATQAFTPVAVARYSAFGLKTIESVLGGITHAFTAGEIDVLSFASSTERHSGNLILTRIAAADQEGRVREYMAARPCDLPSMIWRDSGRPDRDDSLNFFLEVHSAIPTTIQELANFNQRYSEMDITFSLYTNIWFPWIPNPTAGDGFDYDNRQLACFHTPRLNSFLEEVKSVTELMGGRWVTEALSHQAMVTPTGIDLGWHPPG